MQHLLRMFHKHSRKEFTDWVVEDLHKDTIQNDNKAKQLKLGNCPKLLSFTEKIVHLDWKETDFWSKLFTQLKSNTKSVLLM